VGEMVCSRCGRGYSEDEHDVCPVCGPVSSAVDHPSHYNQGRFEVIDVIRDQGWHVDFCLGNALKYVMRAKHKTRFEEDLKKAIWYLQYLVEHP
jgi:hypothetical protein